MKQILLSPDGADNVATAVTGTEATSNSITGAEEQLFTPEGDAPGGETEDTDETEDKTVVTPTGLTKDDITEILKSAGVGSSSVTSTPVTEIRQPPSVEELEKTFNVWKPSAELVAQLRSEKPEDALAALAQIRDGLLRQAMTMAEYRVQQLLKGMRENELSPIQTYVSEQQATSFRNDFFKTNPDLEQYETLIDGVAAKLQAANALQGLSRKDIMKKFADDSNIIVKQLLAKGGESSTPTNGKTTGSSPSRKMSTLTGGGQPTGGRAAAAPKGPSGMEVFD